MIQELAYIQIFNAQERTKTLIHEANNAAELDTQKRRFVDFNNSLHE